MTERDARTAYRPHIAAFFVVVDSGADAGRIVDGPFQHASTAIKRKARWEREHGLVDYRVDNDPDHPQAMELEEP